MNEWSFKVFKEADEKDEDKCAFEEWVEGLQQRDQSRLDRLFKYLRITRGWNFPYVSHREGYSHYELRTKGTVQLRPLGYRTGEKEFTLLFGAIEKGGKLVPRSSDDKADENRKSVERDKERYTKNYE